MGSNVKERQLTFARLSAEQNERDGVFAYAAMLNGGHGCEKDLNKAKELFLRCVELGHIPSMGNVTLCIHDGSPNNRLGW